ncbi:hypothetical protein ACTXT7_013825 [Hymenolepis weldensis]
MGEDVISVLIFAQIAGVTDDMKLHPSVEDSVKVGNLTHSLESPKPKFVPTRPVSRPTVLKQQDIRELYPASSTKIKPPKCFGQCNHIQTKPKLVFRPKRSAPVDDKCNQSEDIVLVKSEYQAKFPNQCVKKSEKLL